MPKRLYVFVIIFLAHTLLIALLIASSKYSAWRMSRENERRLELTILTLPNRARTGAQSTPIASRKPAALLPRKSQAAAVDSRMRPDSALTLSAPIDWTSEAIRVAQSSAERQARTDPYRSFSTHVMGVDIPRPITTQRDGASQSFDGGEVISWVSESCFYTNHGWEPYQIFPAAQLICKDPPRRD
jgi:hypothetical protein